MIPASCAICAPAVTRARRSTSACAASWTATTSPRCRRCRATMGAPTMRADFPADVALARGTAARTRRPRPSTSDRLREALLALGDFRGQVITHTERAWASITFAGSRHTLVLLFAGDEGVEAGERFIAVLPEHEFAIPAQLVADASVTEAEHRLLPAPRLVVRCELLLLEEG